MLRFLAVAAARADRVFWLALGVLSLMLFARLLALAHAGRAYAAYGGIYIVASLLWLWLAEGRRPDAGLPPTATAAEVGRQHHVNRIIGLYELDAQHRFRLIKQ
jgi:drug/metabolite transporter superfamily protein YnfA